MKENTLDRVNLTPEVIDRWLEFTDGMAEAVLELYPDPYDIPDEQAREEPDGSLTIFIPLPEFKLEMRIEPHEWEWSGPRNN